MGTIPVFRYVPAFAVKRVVIDYSKQFPFL